jgi:hypothetical protein
MKKVKKLKRKVKKQLQRLFIKLTWSFIENIDFETVLAFLRTWFDLLF